MEGLLKQLLAWIGTNSEWAYLAVFLAALAESIAVAGVIVPGVMVMFAAGALIANGDLGFWPTAAVAIAGAIIGDNLSFWIGRRYQGHIRASWPLRHYQHHLAQGERFFRRYGTKSVVLGRFFGPVRAVVPLVAGMLQMPPRRFAAANILSALAWGPAYLLPGVVFGASIKLAAEAAGRLAILLLLLLTLIWGAAWLARKLFELFSSHASNWVQALLRWGNLHPVLGRTAQALADRTHPDAKTLAALAAALVGATAWLGIMLSLGLFGAQHLPINEITLDLGQSLHTPLADQIMVALSRLGELTITIPLVVAILVFLELSHQRRALLYWLAALAFAMTVTPLLGWMIRMPRPDIGLTLSWPWSFPNAQILSATVIYGFLAISLSHTLRPARRWMPYAAAASLVASVASARLYLGTEWLTGVVATIALGLAWIALLGLAFRRHTDEPPQGPGLTLVTLLAGVIAFAAATWTQQASDLARYRPQADCRPISAEQWLAGAPIPVAGHREDLWHLNRRPFDIQYAGALETLRAALANQGWQPAAMLDWHNAIKLLSPSLTLDVLPVAPHIHDGHHDDLVLVKDLPEGERLVLRLWQTPCQINGAWPIYVGDVTELRKDRILNLIVLPITQPTNEIGSTKLRSDLGHTFALRVAGLAPLRITPAQLVTSAQPVLSPSRPPSAGTAGAAPPNDRARVPP